MMAMPVTSDCRSAMRPLTVLALTAAIVLSSAAQAQTASRSGQGSFGQGKGGGPLLTRAELRECMAAQDSIRKNEEAARRERQALDDEKAELVRLGAQLKDQLAAVDRSSQEAVDQYNALAAARDQRIDGLEARMTPFNARVEALQSERLAFARRCENRRFDERDEIAIKNGK
jgi:hypothetical protein